MKHALRSFTPEHYIRYMRKQSKHVQHVHAFVFSAAVTSLVAAFILYTDYGFWHETYRADAPPSGEEVFAPESPSESLRGFWEEIKVRFGSIGSSSGSLLEGRETYRSDGK